ncbi:Major facilitator superfamily domain,Acetyl-coenzyme A transporter 1 [Cinara cedri]|uniref:Major facilitator superfamily domain,Acetyl-coenzyme A transporter 1 n=1 Tax=Cinara cedri TaxID=506608 RepID=A0A5E4M7R2_9HEMI|nr:Major facilitator superfamily domain,Acetyl-coenzyme A transporter 1 [Cinara cedri]
MDSVETTKFITKKEENFVDEDDCEPNKPNLKGDWSNIFLLILLYTIQFIPHGIVISFPIIIQSKKSVTYNQQALFSMVNWVFITKILWSPIIESLYVRKIGRRKSWIITSQYIMGILFFYMAINIDIWIPESEKPNINALVILLSCLFCWANVQDIALDGWSITMLKKNNVGHSATCNSIGLVLGDTICSIFLIILTSEDFCNKYLRTAHGTGGIVTIKGFLYFWSVTFILITTLLWIFKKEKDIKLNDSAKKINIIQSYKIVWSILKKPSVRILVIILFTVKISFVATDHLTILKLIDLGIPKENLSLIKLLMDFCKVIVPLAGSKYTSGPKPMSAVFKIFPLRLLWSITFLILIYYTPNLIKENGIVNVPQYYYIILGLIMGVNEILRFSMAVFKTGFISRISDPLFGGMYIALLNTASNMGPLLSKTVALKMVKVLTFSKCSNDFRNNNYSTSVLKPSCDTNNGNYLVTVDGYYVEVIISMIIGLIWYLSCKKPIKNLQKLSLSHWSIK